MAHPDRVFELSGISSRVEAGETAAMAELRLAVRDTIARGISLVLERDRFLRRIADVIADASGYPMVAIYVRVNEAGDLALAAKTASVPDGVTTRISASQSSERPGLSDITLTRLSMDPTESEPSLMISLVDQNQIVGAVVILGASSDNFGAEDLEALGVVAEEIGPAVSVSARHHAIERYSVIDLETGAFTIDFFQRRLTEEVSRAQRTLHSVTIVLIQAIRFRDFEQEAGYDEADRVLRELADGIAAVTRVSDVVARHRRTGFAILLPESDLDGASVAISRIEQQLNLVTDALVRRGIDPSALQLAIGSASYPHDGEDAASLILTAEQRQTEKEMLVRNTAVDLA